MARTWIVVADDRHAEIYETDDFEELTSQERLEHEEGTWRDYDIQAGDRDRHMQPEPDSRRPLQPNDPDPGADRASFAGRMARALQDGFTGESFQELVLVMEGDILEPLVDALPEALEDRIVATVEENLVDMEENALRDLLRERLPQEVLS